jgi:hypothetical protein
MLYQYESEYLFDSTKFSTAFNFAPTAYEEGIRRVCDTIAAFRKQRALPWR